MKNTTKMLAFFAVISILVFGNAAIAEPKHEIGLDKNIIRTTADDGTVIVYSYDKHGKKIKVKNNKDKSLEFDKDGAIIQQSEND